MSTVNTDVINYVQSIGCGTFGKNLYLGRVPASTKQKVPSALWWLVPVQATVTDHNVTGEDTIQYQYELYYRSKSLERVNEKLFQAAKEMVASHCYNLDDYHTIDVKYVATHQPTMIDPEDRVYGWIVFTVIVYNILDEKGEEPEEPNEPTDPTEPKDPNEPTDPEEPTEPIEPTGPEEPSDGEDKSDTDKDNLGETDSGDKADDNPLKTEE